MTIHGTTLTTGQLAIFLAEVVKSTTLVAPQLPEGMVRHWSQNHSAELQAALLKILSSPQADDDGYSNRIYTFTVNFAENFTELVSRLHLRSMDSLFTQKEIRSLRCGGRGVVEFEGRLHGLRAGTPFPSEYAEPWQPSGIEHLLHFATTFLSKLWVGRVAMGMCVYPLGKPMVVSIKYDGKSRAHLQICERQNFPLEDYSVLEVRRTSPEGTTPALVPA